jgi:astacin
VGRQGGESQIWLNFEGDCAGQINGSIIHETMHALGVDHHHIRYDRDSFVRCLHSLGSIRDSLQVSVNHDKIDPQAYDMFALGNTKSYTSYGVPYDMYSIMHYSAYVGVRPP